MNLDLDQIATGSMIDRETLKRIVDVQGINGLRAMLERAHYCLGHYLKEMFPPLPPPPSDKE
jgi:hypothetical protein